MADLYFSFNLDGFVAMNRMRNATILVLRLKGVATEAIKNIVLAGIGKLIVVDSEDVSAQDLGAGFFFRDDDVGKKVCAFLKK
jgi:ubiquitin-like 1-activating enzyme E1 A